MKIFYAICLMILMIGCSEQIKNDKKIQDEVQSSPSDSSSKSYNSESLGNNNVIIKNKENLIGNWVGWFESDMGNQDNDLANDPPTNKEPINPGPCVKAIAVNCSFCIFALRSAASITGTIFCWCALEANSGTTPP